MFKNYKAFCIQFWSFIVFHCCWTVFFGIYSRIELTKNCENLKIAQNGQAIFIFHLSAGSVQLCIIPLVFLLFYLMKSKAINLNKSLDYVYAFVVVWVIAGCLILVILQILAISDEKDAADCDGLKSLTFSYIVITGALAVTGICVIFVFQINQRIKHHKHQRDSLYIKLNPGES